jgi:hypothetical protein
LLCETGVEAVDVPGVLAGVSLEGRLSASPALALRPRLRRVRESVFR